ncbi:hypothetical protein K435DRAFT_871717 [Dendrothele bispora CBS 962.96]|uniref:Uncharacterized protein n=1 Tax=Dendrothele bispora (strain CBS 962.96) TaxID=1314807 RepID=A0A4S8L3R5_DENBC|nr:hypothetical protein K435DRAFT_871717 [Dendrothele bispora CBS 962.96]
MAFSSASSGQRPTPLQSRTTKLTRFREERIADSEVIYTGVPLDTQPACHWYRNGRENILVFSDNNVTGSDDDAATISSSSEADADTKTTEAPTAAVLSMVCMLRAEGFWFIPNAGFTGSSGYNRQFIDAELSAVGVAPDNIALPETATFTNDFDEVQKNIKILQDLVGIPDVANKGFVLPGAVPAFKFKHTLFEKKSGTVDDDSENDELLASWPRTNDAVAKALDDLQEQKPAQYKICPLPAYDCHSALIEPMMYRQRLEGAVVEIRFTLSHWPISAKGKEKSASNAYRANIVDVLVLCPPPPTVVTPRKRKVSAYHPSSPTKKRAVTST